jgi:hypothetical protein
MRKFFRKLFIGNLANEENLPNDVIQKRISNVKDIWNNKYHNDSGIEKILRLFLAISQFFFPGIYIKELFKKYGGLYQELITEAFVICKTLFPLVMVYNNWQDNPVLFYLMLWFMLETLFYIPTLIFASDNFKTPRSFKRSMILLFFNYVEIVFSFGVIYMQGNYLNQPLTHWFDAIYFSFITSSTIGYGEYFPVTKTGKFLVITQSMFYLTFIILFINFFSTRVKTKGYFEK